MDKKNNNEKKALAASVRRFISRYLYRINNQDEFSPEGKLIIQLKRVDLWDKNLRNIQRIEQILDLIKEYDLNVSQSYKLYELIKEEDEQKINAYKEEKEPENMDNNDENSDEEEGAKKNKKKKKVKRGFGQ